MLIKEIFFFLIRSNSKAFISFSISFYFFNFFLFHCNLSDNRSYSTHLQVNCLINMLDNSTAIRRSKDQASTNGAQKSAGKRTSTLEMEDSSSHPKTVFSLDMDHLTLWQHPIITLHYFFNEVFINLISLAKKTLLYKRTVCAAISVVILFLALSRISGPQQEVCGRTTSNHQSVTVK